MSELCYICKETPSKYKCPKCTVRYCSVLCCTKHKAESQSCVSAPRVHLSSNNAPVIRCQTEDENATSLAEPVQATKEPLRLLTSAEKKLICDSDIIKSLLRSKRLQADILSVEQASNRLQSLKKKRENPEFDQFAIALLNVLHSNNNIAL